MLFVFHDDLLWGEKYIFVFVNVSRIAESGSPGLRAKVISSKRQHYQGLGAYTGFSPREKDQK